MPSPLFLLLLPLLAHRAANASPKQIVGVRGVPPARWEAMTGAAAAASTAHPFTCDSGALSLPLSQVNDDFCDCADGSDEPGTGACALATAPAVTPPRFFCPNEGFESAAVHSSRVNDGVCDCCDGSDEWKRGSAASVGGVGGGAACPNTCAEQAANGAAGGEPVVDVQAMAAGARARAVYVEEAKAALAARGEGAHAVGSLGYGEDDAFYGLRDVCLDIQSGVFKYTVCAFEKATQAENGNPEILIGTWVRSMSGAWGRAQRGGVSL